ncbi:MAG TPA: NifB/NifX family molybdenum-iron cluster-binding protein [Gammaproteobacteria bacterium]|nr:NifB/NifX family molybdenum-iron cluster-binding protein [Gammaproteobacteria bacterium]
MKIAVASQNRREITGHTGRCRKFWIYTIDSDTRIAGKRLLELDKSRSFHESSPHNPHPLDDIQVLICGGMGKGVLQRLAAMDIEPVVTPQTDPDASVAAWLDGSLETVPPDAGHPHGETHEHGRNGHTAGSPCGC